MLAAQETPAKSAALEGNTIYLNPAKGADMNSGTKDSPLKTLAEAARRVNQADGTGPITVVLVAHWATRINSTSAALGAAASSPGSGARA